MNIVYCIRDKEINCGVVGTPTDLRLSNGSKLYVGDIVKTISLSTNSVYHAIVVIDPTVDVPILWGFSGYSFDNLKSKFKIRKAIRFDKVTGNEKCVALLNLKLVK